MSKYTCIAKTLHGLEPVLDQELAAMGIENREMLTRAVGFEADLETVYKANYTLRSALRILIKVREFEAKTERAFYNAIYRDIDWTEYLGVKETLAVDAVVYSSVFTHSHYITLLTKDAIVDQFRARFERRPDVNTVAPNVRVHIFIRETSCEVLIDSSGESLHLRGYRRESLEAPINETLAAGMIQLSGWTGEKPFWDPMCGSGTLAIEAAMVAMKIPAQYYRPQLGFFRWKNFDKTLWQSVKSAADSAMIPLKTEIRASDINPRARNCTSINAMGANLNDSIIVEKMAFEKITPSGEPGMVMMNPPYDERLAVEDTAKFYQSIGDHLKQNWKNWEAWMISSNREALKQVGLKHSANHILFNGALECRFQHFLLY